MRKVGIPLSLEGAHAHVEQAHEPSIRGDEILFVQVTHGWPLVELFAPPEKPSGLAAIDQVNEEPVDMIRDRVPGRLGLEPGTDVAVKPGEPTQFLREVERGADPAFAEGGERRSTPSSGSSEQLVELLGQASHRRQTREIVRARRLRRIVDEEHDPTLRVPLQGGREECLSNHLNVFFVSGNEDRHARSTGHPVEPEQLIV